MIFLSAVNLGCQISCALKQILLVLLAVFLMIIMLAGSLEKKDPNEETLSDLFKNISKNDAGKYKTLVNEIGDSVADYKMLKEFRSKK